MTDETPTKSRFDSLKNFYVKHERKILLTTTVASLAVTTVNMIALDQHTKFLAEKGLLEEFKSIDTALEQV